MSKRKPKRVNPILLYTQCCFCGTKVDMQDKRMSCGANCPKRPQPANEFTEGFNVVKVFPPANSTGTDFHIGSFVQEDYYKGISL